MELERSRSHVGEPGNQLVHRFGNLCYTQNKKKARNAHIESPIGSHEESTHEFPAAFTKCPLFQRNGASEATNCVAGRVLEVGWDQSKSYDSLARDRWNEYKNRQYIVKTIPC